jgi:hypothetical protein
MIIEGKELNRGFGFKTFVLRTVQLRDLFPAFFIEEIAVFWIMILHYEFNLAKAKTFL